MFINREAFAAALVRCNLSVGDLAKKAGVSQGTISAVKNGKSCSPQTVSKLTAVLGDSIIMEAM